MLTLREKSPLPKISPEEDRTRDAVDSEPKHYQLSYSGPNDDDDDDDDDDEEIIIITTTKIALRRISLRRKLSPTRKPT